MLLKAKILYDQEMSDKTIEMSDKKNAPYIAGKLYTIILLHCFIHSFKRQQLTNIKGLLVYTLYN